MISYSTVSVTGLPPSSLVPRTALVVDDNPIDLLLTTRFLEKLGWEIMGASSPKRAMELFEQYSELIDILVTDVQMPGMDGYHLADFLRSRHPQLPVLCMSATMEEETRRRQFTSISKPFTFFGLIESVGAAIRCSARIAANQRSC